MNEQRRLSRQASGREDTQRGNAGSTPAVARHSGAAKLLRLVPFRGSIVHLVRDGLGALGYVALFGPWPPPPDFLLRLLAGGVFALVVGFAGAALTER